MKINTPRNYKKISGIIATLIVVCLGCLIYLHFSSSTSSETNEFTFEVDEDGRGVNYDKTATEKQEEDDVNRSPDRKVEALNTDTPQGPDQQEGSGKAVVDVMMTSTGQSVDYSTVDASGFVTNIAESGGMCRYLFSNGNKKVEKIVETLPNPTSTTCKSVTFSSSELGKGEWSVVLSYDSELYTGVSEPMKLIVE